MCRKTNNFINIISSTKNLIELNYKDVNNWTKGLQHVTFHVSINIF